MKSSFVCDHCGIEHSSEDSYEVHTEYGTTELWCESCVDNHAFYCEHCGNYCTTSDAVTVKYNETEWWCAECIESDAVRCDDCGSIVAANYATFGPYYDYYGNRVSDGFICNDCLDHYYACEVCGEFVHEDAVADRRGDYYCPDCDPGCTSLRSYHHTSATRFNAFDGADARLGLYLGIELETEDSREHEADELAHAVLSVAPDGDFECKEDGSLSEGCEIVSQPATLAWHLNAPYWHNILEACRERGATSHDNGDCGLHVHINRAFFGTSHGAFGSNDIVAAFIIDSLFDRYSAEFLKFSRRRSSELEQWSRFTACPRKGDVKRTLVEWAASKYTRYQAVNTQNGATIELRLFRGTLRERTFRATVELAAALALYAREYLVAPCEAIPATWQQLTEALVYQLIDHGIPASDLATYLDERGL